MFELDELFHDKIPWPMLPLLPGISVTIYYTSDPFNLPNSNQMTSPMYILYTWDVLPNVGIVQIYAK